MPSLKDKDERNLDGYEAQMHAVEKGRRVTQNVIKNDRKAYNQHTGTEIAGPMESAFMDGGSSGNKGSAFIRVRKKGARRLPFPIRPVAMWIRHRQLG